MVGGFSPSEDGGQQQSAQDLKSVSFSEKSGGKKLEISLVLMLAFLKLALVFFGIKFRSCTDVTFIRP